MRFIVTGGAGFIGSNIVRALNARKFDDIIVVDDLEQHGKFANLVGLSISDYFSKEDFLSQFGAGYFGPVGAVFHQGACSDTMEHDGRYVMANNFRYSKDLLDLCLATGTRMLYASSAAVYGSSSEFRPDPANEAPLNVYGYSKLLFDNVVRRRLKVENGHPQVAGFRYFNVYGPGEGHKGRMASVAWHHMQQLREEGQVRLFGDYDNFAAGQQLRDFVYVEDVARVNLWFLDNPHLSGIFNLSSTAILLVLIVPLAVAVPIKFFTASESAPPMHWFAVRALLIACCLLHAGLTSSEPMQPSPCRGCTSAWKLNGSNTRSACPPIMSCRTGSAICSSARSVGRRTRSGGTTPISPTRRQAGPSRAG